MKNLYYDVETTGTKYWRHGIHQIGGIIEIDGQEMEEFDIKMKPYHKARYEPEAMRVCGLTEEIIDTYQPMVEGHIELLRILNKYVDKFDKTDKMHLIGYNSAGFDDKFLRVMFELCEDDYFGSWFWAGSLDVMVLSAQALRAERHKMDNFQLGTVCRYVGLEFSAEEAHDAFYDVRKTKELYNIIEML